MSAIKRCFSSNAFDTSRSLRRNFSTKQKVPISLSSLNVLRTKQKELKTNDFYNDLFNYITGKKASWHLRSTTTISDWLRLIKFGNFHCELVNARTRSELWKTEQPNNLLIKVFFKESINDILQREKKKNLNESSKLI